MPTGFTTYGRMWTIDVRQEWIDITSDRTTANERWKFTDSQGHAHRYDHGYPTLDQIIDAEHRCDGHEGIYNHDPHMVIDEAHFVCRECGETIEPAMDPPFTPKQAPGMRSATITGTRSDGAEVETWLTAEELASIDAAGGDRDTFVLAFLDSLSSDRITALKLSR